MSRETPWRGKGMEWGDPREKPCRPHEWTTLKVGQEPEGMAEATLHVCRTCHVLQCSSYSTYGRCQIAHGHPQGTFHRYPDLSSEPVGGQMLNPGTGDPPLQDV